MPTFAGIEFAAVLQILPVQDSENSACNSTSMRLIRPNCSSSSFVDDGGVLSLEGKALLEYRDDSLKTSLI
jgi:hypothetical protein